MVTTTTAISTTTMPAARANAMPIGIKTFLLRACGSRRVASDAHDTDREGERAGHRHACPEHALGERLAAEADGLAGAARVDRQRTARRGGDHERLPGD